MAGRVLIVTGSYYPAVLADTHRARLIAPALKEFGWSAEILAAGPKFQRADAIEPDAQSFFDSDIPLHFARPSGTALFDLLHMRSIGWRAFLPVLRKGRELLSEKRFDLIYISTAQFNFFCLGPLWQRQHHVPYVLDFHDPWVRTNLWPRTTKHRWKFYITALLARSMERFAIERAAGIISVSPNYLAQLRERYPSAHALKAKQTAVLPFAVSPGDFSKIWRSEVATTKDIVYVGAGGVIMEKSWRRILDLLTVVRQRRPLQNLRFRFFGTEAFWRAGDPKFLVHVAKDYGFESVVNEEPLRITYRRALEAIESSAGLLILGVDDPAYMPSKLFLYALAGKPLLASLHVTSQAHRYFQDLPGLGHNVHFDGETEGERDLNEISAFLDEVNEHRCFDRAPLVSHYLASASAGHHAALFNRCISSDRQFR